jgi:chromate transporter
MNLPKQLPISYPLPRRIKHPSFLLILFVAPILVRHRENPNVQGFIKGAYGAAIGTILGACVVLSKIAIGDWLTV